MQLFANAPIKVKSLISTVIGALVLVGIATLASLSLVQIRDARDMARTAS